MSLNIPIASIGSSSDPDDSSVPHEETDEETLEAMHQHLMREIETNEMIMAENTMFENYLRRVDPRLLAEVEDDELKAAGTGRSRRRARRAEKASLTPLQKYEIATRELEDLQEQSNIAERRFEHTLDNLRAVMEETDIRLAEIKKEAFDFRRDILGGEVTRTGKVPAERVQRYWDERLRAKDAVAQRLRLKNKVFSTQVGKYELQLQQKEDINEVVHAIDFEKYKIENEQMQEMIAERNAVLLKLKVTAGNTVAVLNQFKKRLSDLTSEQSSVRTQLAEKELLRRKLKAEIDKVGVERDKAKRSHARQVKQQEEFVVPDVMGYVEMKHELYELAKKIMDWERKVEIAEMNLVQARTRAIGSNRSRSARPGSNGSMTRGPRGPRGARRPGL